MTMAKSSYYVIGAVGSLLYAECGAGAAPSNGLSRKRVRKCCYFVNTIAVLVLHLPSDYVQTRKMGWWKQVEHKNIVVIKAILLPC